MQAMKRALGATELALQVAVELPDRELMGKRRRGGNRNRVLVANEVNSNSEANSAQCQQANNNNQLEVGVVGNGLLIIPVVSDVNNDGCDGSGNAG